MFRWSAAFLSYFFLNFFPMFFFYCLCECECVCVCGDFFFVCTFSVHTCIVYGLN